ncbi:hypothetical protein BC751_2392 [Cecembia calidifontis]|jgi:hypothetical protein|uniref:Uncharacterized protein n=1 Tax=Cecembia calidifontis TaxID=1187080 RepID=A0A4Q7PB69_9BACT|nr:hypothetical protein BC751_2392 [Cecembia calidifontis]
MAFEIGLPPEILKFATYRSSNKKTASKLNKTKKIKKLNASH